MKNVKKIIFNLIVLVLAFAGVALFTACGADSQEGDDQTTAVTASSATEETTIIDQQELERLAREWEKPIEELMQDLEEIGC